MSNRRSFNQKTGHGRRYHKKRRRMGTLMSLTPQQIEYLQNLDRALKEIKPKED